METHIDYKIRFIIRKTSKIVVSVIFNTGYYAEVEGQEVYIRTNHFWGDTHEFLPDVTPEEITGYYNGRLAEYAVDMDLTPIPEQEANDE